MPNLNLISPLNVLGYGQTGYNLLINLSKLYDVAYWPIGNIDYPIPQYNQPIIQKAINKQESYDYHAPTLRIWHQFDMAQSVGKGPRVGFPIFELTRFTEREKHHLSSLDDICVTSKWAASIIKEEIGTEAIVAPLGVDRSIFADSKPQEDGPFRFINIGKWELRKGHDILIDAFLKAFRKTDNVELWMVNHNPFLKPEQEEQWHSHYKRNELGNKITLLNRVGTQNELADIMKQAHCGVFPARAEGWNLELLEMMSLGRKVITTDYSAHTEFCTQENAMLIPITELEEAWDGIWFHGFGEWASLDKPQVDMLSSLMRQAYEAGTSSAYNPSGIATANRFSWENTAKEIQKGLSKW